MASVQDQILRKHERESLLLGSLPGTTRALRILGAARGGGVEDGGDC